MFWAHSALVEAVAEPTFREDLVATAGIVSGLLALAAARLSGASRVAYAVTATLLLVLAASAKETGWLGPVLALASYRHWPHGKTFGYISRHRALRRC